MATTRRTARGANPIGRPAFVLAVVGASLWLGSPSAWAHATLVRSAPAANARLAAEPSRVVLVFDEAVDLALGQATVVGPSGGPVDTGHTELDGGRTVAVALRPGAGNGTYAVSYRVTSLDSHPVSGGFVFSVGPVVGARAAGTVPPTAAGPAAEHPTVSAVYAACRYVGFVGWVLLVGSVVFLLAMSTTGAPARVRRLGWLGYALIGCGSIGELGWQVPYAAGTSLTAITGAEFAHVVHTTFGIAHVLRLVLLTLLAPLLAAFGRGDRRIGDPRRVAPAMVLIGLGLAVTWAYSGHAASTTTAVSVPSDVVHLAAVGVWVGGLLVLVIAVLPSARPDQLRAVLPRWSLVAMACVAALIASGTVQALFELDGWARLGDTSYGHLLLAKIALLVVVLGVANFSRGWVQRWYATRPGPGAGPATDPSRPQVRRLRRAVAAESLLAVAAVGVAAVLIEADPARDPSHPPAAAHAQPLITRHGAYVAAARRGDVVIHLKVDPAVVGVQYIYLEATRPDGHRIDVPRWTLTISNPTLGLGRVNVPVLVDSGVGHHYVYGSFTMTTGGIWTVEVTAWRSDVDRTTIIRKVAVRT